MTQGVEQYRARHPVLSIATSGVIAIPAAGSSVAVPVTYSTVDADPIFESGALPAAAAERPIWIYQITVLNVIGVTVPFTFDLQLGHTAGIDSRPFWEVFGIQMRLQSIHTPIAFNPAQFYADSGTSGRMNFVFINNGPLGVGNLQVRAYYATAIN